MSDSFKTSPLFIIVFAFCFVIIAIGIIYFANTFLNNVPNMFAQGSLGNALYQNGIIAKSVYNNGFTMIEFAMTLIFIGAFMFDVLKSYFQPSKQMGVFNIIMIFVLPLLWSILSGAGILQIGFLISGTGITQTLYSLFISPYFIGVAEITLIISTILNFRHVEAEEYLDTSAYGDRGG